ncbi:eukaryotic translation initiation factor 4 gamma 3 isoform X3 [Protopterus annectens]|uniref:eukaryotic translation initiation factor 4 gamma 3 isoform X3 n=1 Tax=Protopterus annectens TaxID=7888 RepID=UPI001CFBE823|nr:eukaryotic translation initiation factor 4 gamma 3 isoform X3 [Protopterus annectens]
MLYNVYLHGGEGSPREQPPYPSGQNATPPTLVYSQSPQAMNTQQQTRSPFFQRPQIQASRTAIQNTNPSLRTGTPTPAPAVYPTNPPIMMVNPLSMQYTMPQSQYCIPPYRHSPAAYVGPPQQYSVQPPGPNPFYAGPGPGEFQNAYGAAFYSSQPVYQSAPIIMSAPQQLPPAKREKKTQIRIRDPNQGGKDITEEIMSGGGGSRNPTPPIGRPTSTPTPPQFLCSHAHYPPFLYFKSQQLSSQVLDHVSLVYNSTENAHLVTATTVAAVAISTVTTTYDSKQEEKPKQDTVLKSPSPGLRPDASSDKRDHAGQTPDLTFTGRTQELLASAAASFGSSVPFELTDRLQSPLMKEIAKPSLGVLSNEVLAPEHIHFDRVSIAVSKEPSDVSCRDVPVTCSTSLVKELNGISGNVTEIIITSKELPQMTINLETSETPKAEMKVESLPVFVELPAAVTPATFITALPASQLALINDSSLRTSIRDEIKDAIKQGGTETDGIQETEENPESEDHNVEGGSVQTQTAVAPKTWKKPKELDQLDEDQLGTVQELRVDEEPEQMLEPEQEKKQGLSLDRDSPDLKTERIIEQNGEKDAEPVHKNADHFSANESIDICKIKEAVVESFLEDEVICNQLKTTGVEGSDKTITLKEQRRPSDPDAKKQYDREFLLGFQFMPACVQKPDGLPPISDVVLDKINQSKVPLRTLEPRMLARGTDFTPAYAYADFGRQTSGVRGSVLNVGPRRSQQGQRRDQRKILTNVLVMDDVQLKKSENAWKPTQKRDVQVDEPEVQKTQELFRKFRSILNKLTPQMFNQLVKQVTELTVDTEERLKGVIDLVFEKAIDEPSFSVAYANMCRCLVMLKVPMTDKPGSMVTFRKLLLNRCQKEFEKDKADDDIFEKKQKELDAASTIEEKTRLQEELEEGKDKARRRSIGNIKFIGELFKLKMLTEAIMHDCVVKLLKNHDEESLECLCRLLTTIGKDLDFEKAKPRMDQYFNQMEKIVKERKTSSRIRFMLQDVIDLRMCNWVSRKGDQGPKTIEQIHKEAKIEEQEEQRKVYQQLLSKDKRRPGVQRDEGWNTVPMSKNSRVIDPTKFLKISKPTIDDKIQLVPKAQPASWGKGSSGGAKASDSESLRPASTSLNRFSALQQVLSSISSSSDHDSRRSLTSRGSLGREKSEKTLPSSATSSRPSTFSRGSSSKELTKNQSQEELPKETLETVRHTIGNTEDRSGTESERSRSKEAAKIDVLLPSVQDKAALSEEEMERKSQSIIDEFLHINDYKEAMQCLDDLNSQSLLHIFVRVGVESTLERSQITRDHMGQLLYHLIQSGKLTKHAFFKGLHETLELADDMAIDIPHIWLYLAELVTPVLKERGIPMKELFTEISKPLIAVGRAGVLLSEILHLLCKQMSHKKVGSLWRKADLNWKDFLGEGVDTRKFISDMKLEFTVLDSSSPSEALSKKQFSADELNAQLEKIIIEEKANDELIFDWVEANLDEFQMSSPTFLRALMTAICRAAIVGDGSSFRVDTSIIKQRAPVLLKYLDSDTERELQALYALQALIVKLDQPPNLLRMFFDCLYDEEVITEDAFYKWENSKDPAELNGKGVALKSVTAFFTWLREADEESEDN